MSFSFFFFNDTATTEIYTLSLHDALPISGLRVDTPEPEWVRLYPVQFRLLPTELRFHKYDIIRLRVRRPASGDRKSTRLNSSHTVISYAVFCLKKKKIQHDT